MHCSNAYCRFIMCNHFFYLIWILRFFWVFLLVGGKKISKVKRGKNACTFSRIRIDILLTFGKKYSICISFLYQFRSNWSWVHCNWVEQCWISTLICFLPILLEDYCLKWEICPIFEALFISVTMKVLFIIVWCPWDITWPVQEDP